MCRHLSHDNIESAWERLNSKLLREAQQLAFSSALAVSDNQLASYQSDILFFCRWQLPSETQRFNIPPQVFTEAYPVQIKKFFILEVGMGIHITVSSAQSGGRIDKRFLGARFSSLTSAAVTFVWSLCNLQFQICAVSSTSWLNNSLDRIKRHNYMEKLRDWSTG